MKLPLRIPERLGRLRARLGKPVGAIAAGADVSAGGPVSGSGSIRRVLRRHYGVPLSIAAASIVLLGSIASGWVDGAGATLVGMGFDPDRAQLIVSLLIGGTVAAVAYLLGGSRAMAVPLGFLAACLLFGPTFITETRGALAARGALGAFDAMGWAVTVAALLTMATITAWAAATVAMPLRREIVVTARALVFAVRRRPLNRQAFARPAAAALVLLLLALTLPVAGDLFNYGADSHILAGGPPRQGLVPNEESVPSDVSPPEAAPSTATATPAVTASASLTVTPSPSPTPSPTPLPWKASPPTGQSRMVYLAFSAPWKDAGTKTEEVAVYLPPGYDQSGSKRYPTYYEAPFTFWLWNAGIHIEAALDSLIHDGTIPPSLFVFSYGGEGPFADSQCVDSFNGLELMDRFLAVTVPTYIDKHYRTIDKAAARTTIGMSEGGYCAAILALHHPDVFGAAIPFSGYFTAGAVSASSKLPFGNNPSVIARDSPSVIAPELSSSVRESLCFVLVAQTSQVFYGTQATSFDRILTDAGYSHDLIDASQPHGWPQVRDELGPALTLVAMRQAQTGVFD